MPDDERIDGAAIQAWMKEAKDLVRSLEGTAASRVRVAIGALQIEVERNATVIAAGGVHVAPAAAAAPGVMPVVAPLVGVFYRQQSPGQKAFVEVGDTVERGQTLCIIEAMKVMNEVTSDYRGVVKEILVENGEAVQFEQALFQIDVSGAGA